VDARRFDDLTRRLNAPMPRRSTVGLLTGVLLGGLLAQWGITPAHAQDRLDRDGDQLYDDDETNVYGTNPDLFDTDGDGAGDGLEVYNRDNGLGDPDDPLVPDNPAATDCLTNPESCAIVGEAPANPAGNTDLTLSCAAQGLTDCGGVCLDTLTDSANCGACGVYCSFGLRCQGGDCMPPSCVAGTVLCDYYCADLDSDVAHCGACGNSCPFPLICCGGACVDISSDSNNCGGCGVWCIPGSHTCENFACVCTGLHCLTP
jgi:hypothetical protein